MDMGNLERQIEEVISRAIDEDLKDGDVTTEALIDPDWQGKAFFLLKDDGILAGLNVAERVFQIIDPVIKIQIFISDGSKVKQGDIVAKVAGSLGSVLKGERIALNFLQRLSGIASETARYVTAVSGLPVKILDTRKTTPGLRLLEKYAVSMGGGQNHRMSLSDAVLIKDNHLEVLYARGLKIGDIITKTRKSAPDIKLEVETRTLDEVTQAAVAGPDIIMLDNMSLEMMREAVKIINKRALIEASGNITLDNVRSVAETGVDFISVGALTHSVKALDISLEYEK